jgi:putative ubiquitin-RnfH superfamily antitoxin RatB of RatAB toxin-antitoxin module
VSAKARLERGLLARSAKDAPTTAATIAVAVCWASPAVQEVVPLALPAGATVAEAIARSALVEAYGIDLAAARFGIRGRLVRASTVLADGDRIDVCRPLVADPKDARRARAAKRSSVPRPRG